MSSSIETSLGGEAPQVFFFLLIWELKEHQSLKKNGLPAVLYQLVI